MYIHLKTKQEMRQLECKFRRGSKSTLLVFGDIKIYK